MYTILIADDEPGFQSLLEMMLNRAGYRVLIAKDGKEALQLVSQHRPDLILLDHHMPQMTGSDVCQRLKADRLLRHIPVIMHSTAVSIYEHRRWREYGADAILTKPCPQSKLVAVVGHLLGISDPEPGKLARGLSTARKPIQSGRRHSTGRLTHG